MNCEQIDQKEIENKNLITSKDFDDPYIAAFDSITKCRLICSADKRSFKFVKNKILQPKDFKTPVFYTSSKNIDLLSDKYVDQEHKPLSKISKKNKGSINKTL